MGALEHNDQFDEQRGVWGIGVCVWGGGVKGLPAGAEKHPNPFFSYILGQVQLLLG